MNCRFWERRVDAMQQLLSDPRRRFFRSDEFRLMRETMGKAEYREDDLLRALVPAMVRLLVGKGIVTHAELAERMARDRQSWKPEVKPAFAVGDLVRGG